MRKRTVLIAAMLAVAAAAVIASVLGLGPFGSTTPEEPAQPTTSTTPEPTTAPSSSLVDPTPSPTTPSTKPEPSDEPTVEPTASDEPTSPPTGNVDVILVYAAWDAPSASVEASAYVTAFEEAATCTLTLTQGPRTLTKTIDALQDVSTMSCGGLQVAGSGLTPGTWEVVVSYASASSSGTSAPTEVIVP
ncbi:MAG: hypothetical protein ACTMIR_01225 [Cellulomonadaceae bacterium]